MKRLSLSTLGLVALLGFSTIGCEAEVEDTGRLPDVDTTVDPGELPDVDIQTPNVDVDTEPKTINVPDVDVEMPDDEPVTTPADDDGTN